MLLPSGAQSAPHIYDWAICSTRTVGGVGGVEEVGRLGEGGAEGGVGGELELMAEPVSLRKNFENEDFGVYQTSLSENSR